MLTGLKCKQCGETRSSVLYTRPVYGCIERRRKCLGCGARTTTWERPRPGPLEAKPAGNPEAPAGGVSQVQEAAG